MAFSFFKKKTHFYESKLLIILLFLIIAAIVLRLILPSFIVGVVNRQLSKESPNFTFHIDDVDFKIIRGQYAVEGINGYLKTTGEKFLSIDSVSADVPWKHLFKGMVVTDVVIDKLHLMASQKLLDTAKLEEQRVKKELQEESDDDDSKEDSKLSVNSLRMKNSDVTIQNFMSFKGKEIRKISDINVIAKNLIPNSSNPNTDFLLTANVFGPAPLKVEGLAKLDDKPLAWDANIELKNFELMTLNPIIEDKLKTKIEKGKLDDYAELKSSKGIIEGYTKPFISNLKMDQPKGGFKFKGAAAATGGNMAKILLTDSEEKTLATRVPFTYKDKLEYEILPALTKAITHNNKNNIKRGLENSIELAAEAPKQAEEAQDIE